jgi:NTP pyrophosphatase (non-canonical NTP hydrolase)
MYTTMDDVISKVIQWGLDRNIIQSSSLERQIPKLEEEFQELKDAIEINDVNAISDAIGDMTVVLTIMSEIFGKTYSDTYKETSVIDEDTESFLQSCLEGAYEEIKDRKGKLIDGVFVKESDLVSE